MRHRHTVKIIMPAISLVRHGKTEANEKKLYCGHTDLDLSALGENELRELKKTVVYPDAEIFATSGLKRAILTLKILYNVTNFINIPELKEYNFGTFEMKSHDELQFEQSYIKWIEDENVRCPGGESRVEFYKRVASGFVQLKGLSKTVVCICHGGVIAVLMENLFPGEKGFYDWQPQFGRGYTINYGIDKIMDYMML